MDLFDAFRRPEDNLLPGDGEVNDYGLILSAAEADAAFAALLHYIPWRPDEALIYGRHIVTARQTAWYGAREFAYTYSGIPRRAMPWQQQATLMALKSRVEAHCGAVFNSCLLNLYQNGSEGMGWHSDDESALGRRTVIASLSLGAARKFAFKHKRSSDKYELMLHHGQLIVMRGETQQHWLHAVMKTTRVHEPRISLTFRQFLE